MSRSGIRNRPRDKFVMIRNAAMQDRELSLKAKGLLGVMLSFPDDWVYYMHHLEAQSTDGRDSTRSVMRELLTAGYVIRRPARGEDGRLQGYEYLVADYRQVDSTSSAERQAQGDNAGTPPKKTSTGEKEPRAGRGAHRSTGNPSAGKPGGRKDRQTGQPAAGKPEAIKKESTKTKNIKKESSRRAPTDEPQAGPSPTTPLGEERRTLEPRIRIAFGEAFLKTLFEEDKRRESTGTALSADQQAAAFHAAQEAMNDANNTRTFRTVLKEALDTAAGLTTNSVSSGGNPMGSDRERLARLEAASRASEHAYHNAILEGHDLETAERLAATAYEQALSQELHNGRESRSKASPHTMPQVRDDSFSEAGMRGLTRKVLLQVSRQLPTLYRADQRRTRGWGTLTEEQQEAALVK